ncbi:MAG: GtrA family protein [Myxococcales bacterium]|nr:GtrA family protein [Myxococcales bacterium]
MRRLFRFVAGPEGQKIRFLLVGAWNTLFGIAVFTALWHLTRSIELHWIWVAIIANVIAITGAYVAYKLFVFRTPGNVVREYLRFCASYAFLVGVQFAGLAFCVSILHVQPVLANILVVCGSVVVSWLLHNHFTFKRKTEPAASPPR